MEDIYQVPPNDGKDDGAFSMPHDDPPAQPLHEDDDIEGGGIVPMPQPGLLEDEDGNSAPEDPYSMVNRVDLVVCFTASIIELAQAAKDCSNMGLCQKQYGLAVSVGTISAAMCIAYFVVISQKMFGENINIFKKVFGFTLAGLWLVGVIILTFDKPFKATGNGYFATWIAFGCAVNFLAHAEPRTSQTFDRVKGKLIPNNSPTQKAILAIFIGSSFETLAAICECSESNRCTGNNGWAISCGIISLCISVAYLVKPEMMSPFSRHVAPFLVVWWIAGTGWLTFGGPWIYTGNGYFSTWLCMFASSYFMFVAYVSDSSSPNNHLNYNDLDGNQN